MMMMTMTAETMMVVVMMMATNLDRNLRDLYASRRIGSGRIFGDELIERIGNRV